MTSPIQYSFERYEKKYWLSPAQEEFLRERLKTYMKEDAYGQYTIGNLYYDTDDWRLVRASVERPVYKEKLRVRSYGAVTADSPVFAELKKKCSGVVYKRRIRLDPETAGRFLAGELPGDTWGQIGRELEWFQHIYHAEPKVYIGYDRTALSGLQDPELRITFDHNIRWRMTDLDLRCGDAGEPVIPTRQGLMEIKVPGVYPLWLSHLLAEAGAYPVSFSKYGACYERHIMKEIRLNGLTA